MTSCTSLSQNVARLYLVTEMSSKSRLDLRWAGKHIGLSHIRAIPGTRTFIIDSAGKRVSRGGSS